MWLFIGLMVFTVIAMGVTTGLTPYFSRRATPFGISVPVDELKSVFLKGLVKNYVTINVVISVLLALPMLVMPFVFEGEAVEVAVSIYLIVSIFLFMAISFALYLFYRKKITTWKKQFINDTNDIKKTVIIDTNFHKDLKLISSRAVILWQLFIIVMTTLIALLNYDRIPNQIPINFDSQFQANQFVMKSYVTVLAFPGLQMLMVPILYLAYYSFIKSRQKLSPLAPLVSSLKSKLFRQAWTRFFFALSILTQLLISVLFLTTTLLDETYIWIAMVSIFTFLVFTIASSIYLSLKYGQAGEKLKIDNDDETSQYYQDPEDDDKWLAGMFYYNPDDAAIFVEKRFGIGTTVNLARWQAWAFIFGIVILTLAMVLWGFLLDQ